MEQEQWATSFHLAGTAPQHQQLECVSCPGHSFPSVESLTSLLLLWIWPSAAESTLCQGGKCGQPAHIIAFVYPETSTNQSAVKQDVTHHYLNSRAALKKPVATLWTLRWCAALHTGPITTWFTGEQLCFPNSGWKVIFMGQRPSHDPSGSWHCIEEWKRKNSSLRFQYIKCIRFDKKILDWVQGDNTTVSTKFFC